MIPEQKKLARSLLGLQIAQSTEPIDETTGLIIPHDTLGMEKVIFLNHFLRSIIEFRESAKSTFSKLHCIM